MQKEPKQKRSEVPDKKLDELIEEYGNCRANEGTTKCLVQQGGFSAKKGIVIARTNGAKAKQAIIDYHNKKIQEATKYIREVYEKYKNRPLTPYGDSPSDAIGCKLKVQDLWQAIKQTVEGK